MREGDDEEVFEEAEVAAVVVVVSVEGTEGAAGDPPADDERRANPMEGGVDRKTGQGKKIIRIDQTTRRQRGRRLSHLNRHS